MDRDADAPLSPSRPDLEEAKFQLRVAAGDVSLTTFVQRRPLTAVVLAMAAGALVAGSPAAREIFTKEFIKKLIGLL